MVIKHVIQPGETLWSIAKKHFGNPLHWNKIYDANYLTIHKEQRRRNLTRRIGPDWIFPGMELDIRL